MNDLLPKPWKLGREFSINEMTLFFQVRQEDMRIITYKIVGDGFQCDALCKNWFTYQMYFRNHPAPPKYIKMNLPPLHPCVMALFDSLQDKNHACGMDKLYNSVTFCRNAHKHDMRVMVHRVTRKGIR